MKFLASTVLLISAATSVTARCGVNRPYAAPGYIQISAETGVAMCPKPVCNGQSMLRPCNQEGRRRLREFKQETEAKSRAEGRKLQEVGTGPVSPIKGNYESDASVTLEANVGAVAADAKAFFYLVDTSDPEATPTELELQIDETVVDGVASVTLNGVYEISARDENGNAYPWEWYVEVDGVQIGSKATFYYGPAVETRSGIAGVVAEGEYPYGGQVQHAAGRIYFRARDPPFDDGTPGDLWDYVCSGTAIKDNKTGRSIVLTAGHCVWEDQFSGTFGSEVLFIPNRDENTALDGVDPHRECAEDPCGCWHLSGGIIHDKFADLPYPERLAYDYGFYVVKDEGKHEGNVCNGSTALDIAVPELDFVLGEVVEGEKGVGLGYTYDFNPDFRYCADTYTQKEVQAGQGLFTYWLPNCGLGSGASGGPWLKNFDTTTGSGSIVSVNSWSFSSGTGMGGPKIDPAEGRCLMNFAREVDVDVLEAQAEGEQGSYVNCDRPCISPDEAAGRRLRGLREGRQLCAH